MAAASYLMPKPAGTLDLSCFGVTPGAPLTICRDNEWVCEEIGPDCTVEIADGLCVTTLDFGRHDIAPVCPEDVDDKCGCNPCANASGGDAGGAAGDGVTVEQVTQLITDQTPAIVADCIDKTVEDAADLKP